MRQFSSPVVTNPFPTCFAAMLRDNLDDFAVHVTAPLVLIMYRLFSIEIKMLGAVSDKLSQVLVYQDITSVKTPPGLS